MAEKVEYICHRCGVTGSYMLDTDKDVWYNMDGPRQQHTEQSPDCDLGIYTPVFPVDKPKGRYKFTREDCQKGFWAAIDSIVQRHHEMLDKNGNHIAKYFLRNKGPRKIERNLEKLNAQKKRQEKLLTDFFGPRRGVSKRQQSLLDSIFPKSEETSKPYHSGSTQTSLLFGLMQTAVPLHIMRIWEAGGVNRKTWKYYKREIKEYSRKCIEDPEFTEALVCRIPGKSAEAFNATARMVAILSFTPGGVELFGSIFRAKDYRRLVKP